MRTIDDHKVNPANDTLTLTVVDEPGAGGAHHHYAIDCGSNEEVATDILFQNGPIAEVGRKVARANAVQKVWPLLGYELKERLYQAQQPAQAPV